MGDIRACVSARKIIPRRRLVADVAGGMLLYCDGDCPCGNMYIEFPQVITGNIADTYNLGNLDGI